MTLSGAIGDRNKQHDESGGEAQARVFNARFGWSLR
jgi:hypothetical protein